MSAPATRTEQERIVALTARAAEYAREVNRARQARRGGLIEFVRYFWHVLEPNTDLVEGWPLEAICAHLEAIAFGDITRLLVVVPPGFCKSLLTDVFFPAWIWSALGRPSERFVAFSYAASLTERDNGKFRDLILSRDFQEMWGHVFSLRKIGETKVTNDCTGFKLASSIGGVGTGERGGFVILDDPHSIKQAESEVIRTDTTTWFRESMSNRLNDMIHDCIIAIMQRSHYQDVAGVIFDNEMPYCVLMIDMELDGTRQTLGTPNEIGWVDPRVTVLDNGEVEYTDGDLAWPERFPQDVCNTLRDTIGPYGWAAQYQQRPVPRGGGIIKREWWRPWDHEEAQKYGLIWKGSTKEFPVPMELVVGSLDTAYGMKEENSYSAMTVWGVFTDLRKNRRLMLMYAWQKRLPLHGQAVTKRPDETTVNFEQRKLAARGLVEWVAVTCRKYKIVRLLIEDKTRGRDVSNELYRLYARENWGVELLPVCGDKVSRAHAIVPLFVDDAIYAPDDMKWSDLVLTQCEEFPRSANSDLVDTTTQAINWMRLNGILIRADEATAALEDEATFRPPGASVAQQYGV